MKLLSLKVYILYTINIFTIICILPLILIYLNIIQIKINGGFSILFLLFFATMYINFFIKYFIRSLLSIIDLLTNNFISKKMMYINSYVKNSKAIILGGSSENNFKEMCIMMIGMADRNGKKMYISTYPHIMKQGKGYTVQYGKFSKLIISILSTDNEEMLKTNYNKYF